MPETKTALIMSHEAQPFTDWLAEACPDYRFIATGSADEAMQHAGEAEVLIGFAPQLPDRLILSMPRLEWIHALTTGYDNLIALKELPEKVAISISRGIHGPQMAELAVMSMMTLARNFRQVLKNQEAKTWARWPQPMLLDKTVCIIGLGLIAEALADRLAAFGCRLVGVSDGRSEAPGFDRIYRRADLAEAVAGADFTVVLIPLSAETRHIVNDAVLEAMPEHAYLVNIARGGCVDEDALMRHLASGSIAGAALDVFEQEPLLPESPLWTTPNLQITSHIGGMSDTYMRQALPLTVENLKGYAREGVAGLKSRVRPK